MSRVLVVDDEADIRESVEILLNLGGHIVKTVAHARHIIAAVEEFRPDVILQDANMPGLDTVETVRALKVGPGVPPVIFIFSAAANGPELVEGAGADGLVRKPFDFDELAQLIKEAATTRALTLDHAD